MKLRVGGIELEGTPTEIAAALAELRAAGVVPDAQTTFAPQVDAAPVVLAPQARATDGVLRPHNEAILYEYRQDASVSRETRTRRLSVVEAFERTIAPKSFLQVDVSDVRAFERTLIENCRHLQQTALRGGGAVGTIRMKCAKGIYEWSVAKPPSCCGGCPLFARQKTGPAAQLGHLKAFFDFLIDGGLREDNPVERVKKKHVRSLGPKDRRKKKYAPTLDEARELLHAIQIVKTPRDVALQLCLMKWGRRPGHTLLLRARDLVNLEGAGPAWVSFEGVQEDVERINESTWTKLSGNLHSPIDTELRVYLRDVYLAYRKERWGYEPGDENMLFPGELKGEAIADTLVQRDILDPAMEHLAKTAKTQADRARWEAHAKPKSMTRISPGCWRHFYTTQQKLAGIENDDIDYTRGDIAQASRWHYMHLDEAQVARIYRMPDLLVSCDP